MQRYLSVSGDEAEVNAAIVAILSTGYGVTISMASNPDNLVVEATTSQKVIWPICKPCGLRHQPEVTCEDNFQRKLKARAKFVSRQGSPKAPKRAKKSDKPDESGMSGHSLAKAANDDKSGQALLRLRRGGDSPQRNRRFSHAALGPRFRRGDLFLCIMTNNATGITKGNTGVVLQEPVRRGPGFTVEVMLDGVEGALTADLLRTVPQSCLKWTGKAADQTDKKKQTIGRNMVHAETVKATTTQQTIASKAVRRLSNFRGDGS